MYHHLMYSSSCLIITHVLIMYSSPHYVLISYSYHHIGIICYTSLMYSLATHLLIMYSLCMGDALVIHR